MALPPTQDEHVVRGESLHRIIRATGVDGGERTIQTASSQTDSQKLQEAIVGPESPHSLWKRKEERINTLRNLSNPWPDRYAIPHDRNYTSRSKLQLPEANAGPIPHEKFRENLRAALYVQKQCRLVLRRQLLQCNWPREIYKVMAVAMQHRLSQQHLAALHEPLLRALYRCRNNVSDKAVLMTLNSILSRFRTYDLQFSEQLYALGLKFAARTRSLKHMKNYLKAFHETGISMSSNVFRSAIAKFSIGHRGLGEIRNGRWRRDELLQVLTGFDDCKHLPPEKQYHLGTFLNRDDWQYLHGWIAVLARCKEHQAVWDEWLLWKNSEARRRPKKLATLHKLMTTKLRGDYWFLEQMTYSGGLEEAWQILDETGIDIVTLKDRIKSKLLEGVEHARVRSAAVSSELLRKYDMDLMKVEAALGVRWVSEGYHEMVKDQEAILEVLGSQDWKLEDDHGYPYETSPIVPDQDKSLHHAEEGGLAEG